MPVAYFSKTMNTCEQRYLEAEKECLAVLYAVNNFRPYLYGREFILAYDYEPIHWITYVENPGVRLLRWKLRLQDYQYKFEYKQGKLNRGVEALPGNPATETDLVSSTESSEDSDDSDGMSQSHSQHKRRVNPETARANGHIPTRTNILNQQLVLPVEFHPPQNQRRQEGKLLSTESHRL